MNDPLQTERLALTQEEALGLLDLALLCPDDLTPEQRSAVVKLSEYCRQRFRDDAGEKETVKKGTGRLNPASVFAA